MDKRKLFRLVLVSALAASFGSIADHSEACGNAIRRNVDRDVRLVASAESLLRAEQHARAVALLMNLRHNPIRVVLARAKGVQRRAARVLAKAVIRTRGYVKVGGMPTDTAVGRGRLRSWALALLREQNYIRTTSYNGHTDVCTYF